MATENALSLGSARTPAEIEAAMEFTAMATVPNYGKDKVGRGAKKKWLSTPPEAAPALLGFPWVKPRP